MKVHLLTPAGADPAPARDLDQGDADLVRDLGLDDVVTAMAGGDALIRDVALDVLLRPLTDLDAIRWRQDVVRDALDAPAAVAELYRLATDAVGTESRVRGWWISNEPSSVLGRSVALMRALLGPLRDLRSWADGHGTLPSAGMRDLVAEVTANLTEEWFREVEAHLRRLSNPDVVLTLRLGPTGTGSGHVLASMEPARRSWLGRSRPDESTILVPESDTAASQALTELRERGLRLVANALAQSAEQVLAFFGQLRREAAFLLGCATLEQRLRDLGLAVSFPEARPVGRELAATALVDVGLAMRTGRPVVANDLVADGAAAVVVTGANQGGKSTLLRAVGLAQLMAQAGMFVGAASLRTAVAARLHSHFRREEDDALESGKLREELLRMSAIVDRVSAGDLVLSNESFASTNEREASRIARQLLDGLVEGGLRVAMVTHLTEFSRDLAAEGRPDVVFLRAERAADGARTFRVVPGGPLPTGFGADLWERVLGG